jgi:limonene-1,2-epoxide hydrolase
MNYFRDMKPKELLEKWIALFNQKDVEGISDLYSDDSVNHQTPLGIVKGKDNIRNMFKEEFGRYEMVCIIENIFEDGNVGILEWKDPNGLRGCGFFWFENNLITYQRGYWDKLSFMEQQQTHTENR